MSVSELIYDWNTVEPQLHKPERHIGFDDETLRDGLQSPSVCEPSVEKKIELLHLMDALGIDTADIGLPGAGGTHAAGVELMAREIADQKMKIRPNCAARTHKNDIIPIAEISQRAGIPIEACTFIGSSPIRFFAEEWTLDKLLHLTEEAVTFAVSEGLPVMFVTEDTNYVPYTAGYWQYSNVGFVWVSNEPFAWATAHYGRWAFSPAFGRWRDAGA